MISMDYVVAVHDSLIQEGSCAPGIRDENLLNSAVEGQYWYNTVYEKYLHVAYSINTYHVYSDGNKRTAFIILKSLEEHGFLFDDRLLCDLILKYAKYSGSLDKDTFSSELKECMIDTP